VLAETLAFVASGPAAHSWHIPSVALDFLAESAFRAIVIHVPMGWRVFRAGGMEWAYGWHPVFPPCSEHTNRTTGSALYVSVPVSAGVVKRI